MTSLGTIFCFLLVGSELLHTSVLSTPENYEQTAEETNSK